jgi:hypothetical protein
MVVILSSAAAVFWMEYRRFVRTRRYWVLMITTLMLGGGLTLGLGTLAYFLPERTAQLLGLSYTAHMLLGVLVGLPSIIAQPLSRRMLTDTYKTYTLTDLYLTELHPLGVLLGRAWATVALTGVSLLTLTPFALWLCALLGIPAWSWWVSVPLGLASYLYVVSIDAYALRENHPSSPMSEATLRTRQSTAQGASAFAPLSLFAVGIASSFLPTVEELLQLPLWALSPFTAPLLTIEGQVSSVFLGFALTLGTASWLLLCAAQWRDWWSDAAYRWMRWGGTAFWTLSVALHTSILATVFVQAAAGAERFLLFMICLTALLNLAVAPLMGYYGLARRPKPASGALPYPWGGLMWQWALQWIVALTLYFTLGLSTGHWVALERWLLWAVYAWVGVTLLSQAWQSVHWGFLSRAPTLLQGDYYCGWLVNTHLHRASFYRNSALAGAAAGTILSWLGLMYLATLGLRALNGVVGPVAPLTWLADWFLRLHPWWGFYREWMGVGNNWGYVLYAFALAVGIACWRGWKGVRFAQRVHEDFQMWQKRVEEERQQREATEMAGARSACE